MHLPGVMTFYAKTLLFTRVMMPFKVERALRKLVPCVVASASLALWSMMRLVGVVIQVRANVSLEVVWTVWGMRETGGRACEIFAV